MRTARLVVPVLVLALVAGCGGSGGVGLPGFDLQALADCTGLTIAQIGAIFAMFGDLLDVAQGGSVPTVVFGPGGGPNSFTYSASLDLDGDATFETMITGGAVFSADPTDGIDVGDTVNITVNTVNGTLLTGNGHVGLTLIAPDTVQATPGALSLTGVGGCGMDVTAMDLTVPFSGVSVAFPTGTLDFEVTALGDLLLGTITFDGSPIANVAGSVNASLDVDFDIDLS